MHLIIFIWGFTGILGKLILLDAIQIVWYRVVIAFVALSIYFAFTKKSIKTKSTKSFLEISLVGLFVAIHWLTFYHSIQLSTASLGILCLSTTTLHVAWMEPLVMKRKISLLEIVLSLVVVLGIYITSSGFTESEYTALFYGLISALFAALFSVFNTKIVEKESAGIITFYEMLSASVGISVFLIIIGRFNFSLFEISYSDFYWLLFLGIVCTSFAFLATVIVLKQLGAFTVSLSINLEPIYTLFLAIFILNENDLLSTHFYIGAVVIIIAVLSNGLIKGFVRRKKKCKLNAT